MNKSLTAVLFLALIPMAALPGRDRAADRPELRDPRGAALSSAAPGVSLPWTEVRPEPKSDRGRACAEEARAQRLHGDDYRFFMIRCMNR